MNKKLFLTLFIFFLVSVLLRFPVLNRPLSKHHEFCTAISLRVMQIWDEAGIATYNFNPVMTYPNAADKFINNYASGSGKMLDEEGSYYYVSHPPLAYYVPYFLFQLIGVRPDVLPIQLFNLLLHFISAIGIYLIVRFVVKEEHEKSVSLPALAGFTFYLFSAATMWFQSNTYMSDMAVQPLFIYGILFALKYFEDGERKHLLLLSLFVFLMTYTTWLGVFFATILIAYGFLCRKELPSPGLFIVSVYLCAFLGVALTIFQYAQIAGWNAYYDEAFGRFSERSGMQNGWRIFYLQWRNVFSSYITSYLPLLIVVLSLLVLKAFRFAGVSKLILVAVLPILLLHLVLLNYSGHDFVSLYGAVFLSIVAGIGSQYFLKKRGKIFTAMLSLYVLICIGHFYYVNRPGQISQRGDRYADFKDIGNAVKKNSNSEEVIFLLNEKVGPEVIFYAERNILRVANEDEAMQHLQKSPANKGVLFKKSANNKVEVVRRISEQ